ncbi:MAG: hypothetical protein ACRCZF_20625, partial [Gemmataceae bacterium]
MMSSARANTATEFLPAAKHEARLRRILHQVRDSVSEHVFSAQPASVSSVAGLLAAAPVTLCKELVETWRLHPELETVTRSHLTDEECLTLELVLGMYDWGSASKTYPAL